MGQNLTDIAIDLSTPKASKKHVAEKTKEIEVTYQSPRYSLYTHLTAQAKQDCQGNSRGCLSPETRPKLLKIQLGERH